MLKFRPYTAADRAWVFLANVAHYRDVEGFDYSFADAVEQALDDIETPYAYTDRVIAERDGASVGCIFLVSRDGAAGRIRLFYLAAEHRGQGGGRAVLSYVLNRARKVGLSRIDVSTFDRHMAACALYRYCGFTEAADPPSRQFGQTMRRIDFSLTL